MRRAASHGMGTKWETPSKKKKGYAGTLADRPIPCRNGASWVLEGYERSMANLIGRLRTI